MTKWEYLSFEMWWGNEEDEPGQPPDHWRFRISALDENAYSEDLVSCSEAQSWKPLLQRFGSDGWELVTAVEGKRNQFSRRFVPTEGEPFVAIWGQLTSVTYIFKRPITD